MLSSAGTAADAVALALSALAGGLAGAWVNRAAGAFPWPESGVRGVLRPGAGRRAVRRPIVEVGTAVLLVLTVLRFGLAALLPAFLLGAVAAVLLAVVDLQHQVLPDRVVLPVLAAGTLLLTAAAAGTGQWPELLRAVLGAAALFATYLALALVSPGGLGMGDVKLAALLGLYLGWLGWPAVLLGTLAAFAGQALAALVLLAARRVQRTGALPFGPAMLVGAALAIGWPG